jgi:hypothetical protein
MKVPEFSDIVSVVARLLHPKEEVVVVDALLDNFWIPSMRRRHVGNIVIMRRFPGP